MIGLAIRQLREDAGLTQEELGQALEGRPVTRVTVSRYETGQRRPSPQVLKRIADALNTTPERMRRLASELEAASKAADQDEESGEGSQSRSSEYVQSWSDLRRWQRQMGNAEMAADLKLVLALLGVEIQEGPWVVPVTVGRFVVEKHLGRELVERAWPQLLESPWIERVGDVEWVFRLRFPQN